MNERAESRAHPQSDALTVMHDEFLVLINALDIPLLSEDDIDALNRLQKQWEHLGQRKRQ